MVHCEKRLKSGNLCQKLANHRGRHRGTQHDMSRWLANLRVRYGTDWPPTSFELDRDHSMMIANDTVD